ncbi:Kinetochore-associated protein KNL-2 homolog [Linum grandiflorum]
MAASPVADHTPTTASNHRKTSNSGSSSYFPKTVTLKEWWLIRTGNDCNGKSLGVAGYVSSVQRVRREFHSAPVIKRHDVFTVETADDVTVFLDGPINRTCTLAYGFPPEIFDHFGLGFPFYWKQCEKRWCEVEADEEKAYADTIHKIGMESTPIAENDSSDVEADEEKAYADTIHNIGMESTAIAENDSSDVEVMDDDYRHIQSEKADIVKASKCAMLHSPVGSFGTSACEEVNVEDDSSPTEEGNEGHTSFPAAEEYCEAVSNDGSKDIPSSPTPSFHTTSASSLQDVVADKGASSNSKAPSVDGVADLNCCSSEKVIGDGRDNVVDPNVLTSNRKTRSRAKRNKTIASESTDVLASNQKNVSRSKAKRKKKIASASTELLDEGKLDETVHQTPPVRKSNRKVRSVNEVAALDFCSSEEVIGDGRGNVVDLNVLTSNQKNASRTRAKRNKKVASESTDLLDEGKLEETVHQTPPIRKSNRKVPSVNGVAALDFCSSEEVIGDGRDNVVDLNVSTSNQKNASRSKVKRNKRLASESTKPLDEGKLDGAVHQTPAFGKSNSKIPSINEVAAFNLVSSEDVADNGRDNVVHLIVSESNQKTASRSKVKRNKKLASESTKPLDEGKLDETVHQNPPIRTSNRKVPSINGVAALDFCSSEEVIGNGRDNVVDLNISKSNQKTRSQAKRKKKIASESTKPLDEGKLASESTKPLDEGKLDETVHQTPPSSTINEQENMDDLNVSKFDQKTASGSTVKRNKRLRSESNTMVHDEGKLAVHQTPAVWKSNRKIPSVNEVAAFNLVSSEDVVDNGRDNVVHLNVSKSNQKTASRSKVKRNKKLAPESTKPLDEGNLDKTVQQTPPPATNVSKFDQNTASGSTVKRNRKLRSGSTTMVHDEAKLDGAVHQTPSTEVRKSRRKNKTSETANIINPSDGGSAVKKAAKRSLFESPVTPNTPKGKTTSCLHSPESLNLKRSRSGRLLMPTLEFWRNQSPIYDAERKVIGILEEVGTPRQAAPRGSRSEPPKKKPKTR